MSCILHKIPNNVNRRDFYGDVNTEAVYNDIPCTVVVTRDDYNDMIDYYFNGITTNTNGLADKVYTVQASYDLELVKGDLLSIPNNIPDRFGDNTMGYMKFRVVDVIGNSHANQVAKTVKLNFYF